MPDWSPPDPAASVSGMPCLREALYENVLSLRRRLWHRKIAEALATTRSPGSGPGCLSLPASRRRASGRVADPRWRAGAACLCLVHRRRALGRGPSQDDRAASSGSGPGSAYSIRIALVMRYADPRRAVALLEEAAKLATETAEAGTGDPHFLPRRPLSYSLRATSARECRRLSTVLKPSVPSRSRSEWEVGVLSLWVLLHTFPRCSD